MSCASRCREPSAAAGYPIVIVRESTDRPSRTRGFILPDEALLQVLTNTIYRFKRVGLEAGPLSQWLYSVLAERAVLKAQINKT
jgi:transposase